MKSKLLFIDLAVCSVWTLSMLGSRDNWLQPTLILAALSAAMRLSLSFCVFHYKEKRSWLPAALFAAMLVLAAVAECDNGVRTTIVYAFELTGMEHDHTLRLLLQDAMGAWVLFAPLAIYLLMLPIRQLRKTDLTWADLAGTVLWRDRLTRTYSALMLVTLAAFFTGLSMDARTCQLTCLAATPLGYWILCRYYRAEPGRLWMLVAAMCLFWYAQLLPSLARVAVLLASLCMVAHVAAALFRTTKSRRVAILATLYLAVLLPSLAIGYNQYACLDTPRAGFHYLAPFRGILYVTDGSGQRYGLRDRYGLLVKPEYESIRIGNQDISTWRYIYIMKKDGERHYYDAYNNQFVLESEF